MKQKKQIKSTEFGKHKKIQRIGEEVLRDEKGNLIKVAIVEKEISSDINFFKVWIAELAGVLGVLGNKKMKAFEYIIDNIDRSNNMFLGTVREISEGSGVSIGSCQEALNILIECDFMRKIRISQYLINPSIMAYGDGRKRGNLLIKFAEAPEKTPIDRAIEEKEVEKFEKDKPKGKIIRKKTPAKRKTKVA